MTLKHPQTIPHFYLLVKGKRGEKTNVEIDLAINENEKHAFIEKKVAKAINTLKKVGLPKELVN